MSKIFWFIIYLHNTKILNISGTRWDIMTKRKTPFFFTFKGFSNSTIFQYLNFSFHRHFNKLQGEFHFSIDSLQKVFIPHEVALEPYVKIFHYKILNSILYTNNKLYKIGFSLCNKCTFCQSDLETLHHLLYNCPLSKTFWNEFEQYWFSITKERICLTKRDIIVDIITRSCLLLNYLLIIAKLYL